MAFGALLVGIGSDATIELLDDILSVVSTDFNQDAKSMPD